MSSKKLPAARCPWKNGTPRRGGPHCACGIKPWRRSAEDERVQGSLVAHFRAMGGDALPGPVLLDENIRESILCREAIAIPRAVDFVHPDDDRCLAVGTHFQVAELHAPELQF